METASAQLCSPCQKDKTALIPALVNYQVTLGSLLSCTLDHGVLLAGTLEAGRRPGDGPAVGAWYGRLNVPLQEVEQRIPPGVGEVVVGRAFKSLSRERSVPLKHCCK